MLRHSAALALYQEVTLLNRYVRAAARRAGYRPYIVRLQVGLIPYHRKLPYDSYTEVSFFTLQAPDDANRYFSALRAAITAGDGDKMMRHPVVVPLLVTDNLEGSRSSSSTEILRQLSFALGALSNNVQLGAGTQALRNELRSLTGTTLNSLQTVVRQSDNTIRVRFGAPRNAADPDKPSFVMVPNTHNVTLLVMAPLDWVTAQQNRGPGAARLHVTARNVFRDSETGEALRTFDAADLHKSFRKLYEDYFADSPRKRPDSLDVFDAALAAGCPKLAESEPRRRKGDTGSDGKLTEEALQKFVIGYLFDRAINGDHRCFAAGMLAGGASIKDHEYLWADLVSLSNSYGQSEDLVELPRLPAVSPPPFQTAIVNDDGKAAAVRLAGGKGLASDRISAALVGPGVSSFDSLGAQKTPPTGPVILARSIAVNGGELQIGFPPVLKACTPEQPKDAKPTLCGRLIVWQDDDPWQLIGGFREAAYPAILRSTAAPEDPAFFATAIAVVAARADQTGTVRVLADFEADKAVSIAVSAKGGEIVSATFADPKGPDGVGIKLANGTVTIAGKAKGKQTVAVDLGLRNLVGGETLTLAAIATSPDGSKASAKRDLLIRTSEVRKAEAR